MLQYETSTKQISRFKVTYQVLQGKADNHSPQCDSAAMSLERGP